MHEQGEARAPISIWNSLLPRALNYELAGCCLTQCTWSHSCRLALFSRPTCLPTLSNDARQPKARSTRSQPVRDSNDHPLPRDAQTSRAVAATFHQAARQMASALAPRNIDRKKAFQRPRRGGGKGLVSPSGGTSCDKPRQGHALVQRMSMMSAAVGGSPQRNH
jgi:hypothetical protein